MRIAPLAALLLIVSGLPVLADECRERVARLVVGSMNVKPSKGHMIYEVKGSDKTESEFVMAAWDHTLYRSIVPADPNLTLTYKGTMFQSSDEGKTWKKLYSYDSESSRAEQVKTVEAQIGSIKNAICGEEEFEGVMHNTLEADMSNPDPYPFEMHNKYWVSRETGFVAKATSLVKQKDSESMTTQTWVQDDGITLPIPE
jgi:hypothetical protein